MASAILAPTNSLDRPHCTCGRKPAGDCSQPRPRPHKDATRRQLYISIDGALDQMHRSQIDRNWERFQGWERRYFLLYDELDLRDGYTNKGEADWTMTTYETFMGPISVVGEEWIGYPR